MRARAAVSAHRCGGRTVLSELSSEPPWGLRPVPGGVAMVGTAAGPVGGDELALRVEVGPGADLTLEAVAATIVWPGRDGTASRTTAAVTVGAGGRLRWIGRPLVSVAGSTHAQETTVELAGDARLNLVEEMALGRSEEPPGRLTSRLRVVRDGLPLLDHRPSIDPAAPGHHTTAGTGGHRHLLQQVIVGTADDQSTTRVLPDAAAARFALGEGVVLRVASGRTRPAALTAPAALDDDEGDRGHHSGAPITASGSR